MPYIYPPQSSAPAAPVSKKNLKPSRYSLDSEYAVEEELDQHYSQDYPCWQPMDEDVMAADENIRLHGHHFPPPSLNGRGAYLPTLPDDKALSLPVDDWSAHAHFDPVRASRDEMAIYHQRQDTYDPYPIVDLQIPPLYQYPAPAQPGLGGYDPAFHWSPSCAYPAAQPLVYRAPVLHPRHVQLNERPITPHDTYRYPDSHADHIYIANAVDAPTKEVLNEAFAAWYVDQIIELLVKPGQYRPGVGGQAEEVWGPAGREKDSWERVGRSPPDYSKPWGRMGMTSTPAPVHRHTRTRQFEDEARDPWNVIWSNKPVRSVTLVAFVADMLQRMSISPVAVVSAVWFMQGLGLHDGDGQKGSGLRDFLRGQPWSDLEAIEKRIATLGLLLAGKWLDDNSFLTKSWSEVTSIPIKQIDRMERCALKDLHFSLYIPISAWSDHVNQLFTALYHKPDMDELDAVVVTALDQMVTEARESELSDPKGLVMSSPDFGYERHLSAQELPAAADQAINRDWGTFARSFSIDSHPAHDFDADLEAERTVAQLVDDEDMIDNEEDEDEEEFLDYDGAKRWLPSVSELRRSSSNSSSKSNQSVDMWRTALPALDPHVAQPSSSPSSMYFEKCRRHRHDCPCCHNLTPITTAAKAYPTPPAEYVPKVYPRKPSVDCYLEPGISIVRPSEITPVHFYQSKRRARESYTPVPTASQYW